jgi:hypothetical protein
MTKKDIENKVLDKIKKGNVKPIPKWEFVLKRVFVWILFILSVFFGAFAVSVIIFLLKVNDWEFYEHISGSLPVFILETFPYFWLLLLVILGFVAYFNFRNTGRGYKYRFSFVMFLSVFLSIVLGAVLFRVGVARSVEHFFLNSMPFYMHMNVDREMMWLQPENGLLAGKIIERLSPDELLLLDFNGKNWRIVNVSNLNTFPPVLDNGNMIRIVGEIIEESVFSGKQIAPWQANRKFLKENLKPLRSN